ncbi:MAG: AMP-binding protein [Salibacteraceae bacterium]
MKKDSITLNGEEVNLAAAQLKLNNDLPEWERHIFQFLCEWWNNSTDVLVNTSGSTGTPKTIKRSKNKMRISAQMTGEFFNFKAQQKALLCLPANFIAGKMMLVRAMEWNLDLDYIEPKIDLQIPKTNYYFSAMIPAQVETCIHNLQKISNLLIGGAPVNSSLEKELTPLPTHFYVSYGMTETVSHVAIRNLQKENNQIYTALNDVSFTTTAQDELIISAPRLLNTPITTTDVVSLINKSQFKWVGRSDFMINSGGLKISPESIERKLTSIIPSPFFIHKGANEKWGEAPILVIEGDEFSTQELLKKIRTVLPKPEVPVSVKFSPLFTTTRNGKLNRIATFNSIK